jgi:hypothetical protein
MSLENEIAQELSEKMCSQIDFEILSDVLVSACGWTKIILTPMTHEQSKEIDSWLADNCKGEYRTMGLVFLFEQAKDVTWFTLKYS